MKHIFMKRFAKESSGSFLIQTYRKYVSNQFFWRPKVELKKLKMKQYLFLPVANCHMIF